ncbi:hypothetical protein VNO78_16014 [Psophocarpus tetragonolobus]|uniref:Uncharacterized protein n=1 Tax=Psophocarpus tetragonolobus TaxID=3891 RepID=A0AAN9SHI3_PSOTE
MKPFRIQELSWNACTGSAKNALKNAFAMGVCRIHCSSRRSLREDPNFDKLIGELTALLPNSNGNRENLQNARSKASKRKSIAEGKKPATSASRKRLKVKDLGRSSSNRTIRRSPRFAGCSSKSERALPLISEEKEIVFIPDTDITESETKETNVETSEVQAQIAIGTSEEVDNPEAEKVDGIISSAKTLIWGGTGHRSNNRHRSNSMTVAAARINRLARFIDHLEESEVKDNEYVALETQRSIEEIELCLVKECHHDIVNGDGKLDPEKCNFEVLARQEETLAELKTNNLSFGHLVIAFKKKIWDWDLNDEYVLSE